jgi:hypothetical protein
MKSSIHFRILLILFLAASFSSFAQDEEQAGTRIPRWISEKGYWVVESNINTPYQSTIHFYNNDNVLVYREKVDGVKVNLNRNRTKMKLKKILEESIIAWNKTHLPRQDQQWVSNALKQP